MSIQSLKHRIQKRVSMKRFKQDYSDIGSLIKKKRKELDVTQDEISNGICSISYLSKIENNQIVPSDFYVREIMDKLDIDQAVFAKSIKDKQYVRAMLEAIYYKEDDMIQSIYDEIEEIEHNVAINVCKLGYTIYYQLEDDNQYVMMLEHVVNNMTDLEVELYLYYASVFFVERKKYKTALELYLLYDQMPTLNEQLDALFHDLAYSIKQQLTMKNCASDDYQHAMTLYQKHGNVYRMIRLAMDKVSNIGKEHPKLALTMMNTLRVGLLSQVEQDEYHYLKATIQCTLQQYQDAVLSLKQLSSDSDYYYRKMTLLLEICMVEQDMEMMEEIKCVLASYTPSKQDMNAKIHYHYLMQKNEEDKKVYLRDIAIPFSIKVEDYQTLYQYTKAIMDICINHSRYKEATQFFHKYEKEMNKIEQLMY